MTTLDRLERETETTRTRVAELLDELRGRVSPGELVDQIVESIGDGAAGDFVRTLGAQIRDNPLPCLMIGAGVAWLVTADYRVQGAADGSSNATESAMDQVDHTMYRAREMAADAGERVADAAGSATAAVSSGLHGAARSARDAGRSAAGAGRRASGSFAQLLREQPLVTAGLGLALGALLGAALPSTETESRMVGETSDAVKARARDALGEGIEKAKAVAERTYEAAKHEAAAAAEHVKDEAVHAAGEQGFATGTLRAEHERVEAEHPDAT